MNLTLGPCNPQGVFECHTNDETAMQPKTKASDRSSRFPIRSPSPVSSPSSRQFFGRLAGAPAAVSFPE